jgi:uncharacterized protein (DUF427 family)
MTAKQILIPGPDHPITTETNQSRVTVTVAGHTIADTHRAVTLRESTYPPVHYIPIDDVDPAVLEATDHATYCPFKGDAAYYTLRVGDQVLENAVWTYPMPYEAVSTIAGHVAFYPDRVELVEADGSA